MSTIETTSQAESQQNGDATISGDVLTLAEAAAYLRVPEEAVLRAFRAGGLPGRLIDDQWRFLKSALQTWLQAPPKPSSNEAMLSLAGAWKDDPYLEEMLADIYKQRGRSMVETDE